MSIPLYRCLSFFIVVFLFSSSTGFRDFSPDHCIVKNLPSNIFLESDQVTILVNGFSESRIPLLRSIVTVYSNSPYVDAVLILWGNPRTNKKTLKKILKDLPQFGPSAPVSIIRQPTDSLNARFIPRSEIRTRAVAICDDDIEMDSKSLEFAFKIWKSHPEKLVGFFARSHDFDLTERSWIYTVHPDKFSIILTKFMILKTDYLYEYSCGNGDELRKMREYVDQVRNCEDILMNFLVARLVGSGPILVEGNKVRDWGDTRNENQEEITEVGLSKREDHRKKRGICIREFHRILRSMPLRYSYGKIVEGVGEQGLCEKGGKLMLCDE